MDDVVHEGLSRLSEGFAILDADLDMITCNSRFGELRGFPPELCQPGVSFHALVEHRAGLGDFGECDITSEAARRCAALKANPNHHVKEESR